MMARCRKWWRHSQNGTVARTVQNGSVGQPVHESTTLLGRLVTHSSHSHDSSFIFLISSGALDIRGSYVFFGSTLRYLNPIVSYDTLASFPVLVQPGSCDVVGGRPRPAFWVRFSYLLSVHRSPRTCSSYPGEDRSSHLLSLHGLAFNCIIICTRTRIGTTVCHSK